MKRVVRASANLRTDRNDLFDLVARLKDASVTEHTMLRHFFDYLPAKDCIKVLEDLADEIGIDDEEGE